MINKHDSLLQYPYPISLKWLPLFFFIVLVAAFFLDQYAFEHFPAVRNPPKDKHNFYRIAGYLPSWLLIATGLFLCGVKSQSLNFPLGKKYLLHFILLSPIISGILAAILKVFVRRKRIDPDAFVLFDYRSILERTIDGGGLSFPSEHAAVAFGGCIALCAAFPRASLVWLFWGFGCAYGRIAARDHYLTDTIGSFFLAYVCCYLLAYWFMRLQKAELEAGV